VLSLVRQLLEYDAVETRRQEYRPMIPSRAAAKTATDIKKIVGEKYFRALKRGKMKKGYKRDKNGRRLSWPE